MTAKPSVFEKAIVGSHDYDADIRAMVREGKGAREVVHDANDTK
jgi:hypothetical protein